MIDVYEDSNKVYAENYSKIIKFVDRNDVQKSNDIPERLIYYRGGYKHPDYIEYNFWFREINGYYYVSNYIDISIKKGDIKSVKCDCKEFKKYKSCVHIAACFRFYSELFFGKKKKSDEEISLLFLDKYMNSKGSLKKELNVNVNIKPIEYYDEDCFEFKVSIGYKKMYSLNAHFNSFKSSYLGSSSCKFGKELVYNSNDYYFNSQDKVLIDYLVKKDFNLSRNYLTESELAGVIPYLNFPFNFDNHEINYINESFPFKTSIMKKDDTYELSFDFSNSVNIGNKYVYFNGDFYSLNSKEGELVKDLMSTEINKLKFKKNDFDKFTGGLLSIIKDNIEIDSNMKDELIIVSDPGVKLYFDINNKEIVCNCKFDYNGLIDYFDNNENIYRNSDFESKVINDIFEYGFNIVDKRLVLDELDKMVSFIDDGLNNLALKYDIFTSEKLKSVNIKKKVNVSSMFSIGQDNIMSYNFNFDGLKNNEIANILKSVKAKKKYYRLKNGDILNLEDDSLNEFSDLVDDMDISDADIINGKGSILKYRAIYLDSLRKSKYKHVETDNLFDNFIDNFYKYKDSDINLSKDDLKVLRDYQVTGVKWLYNLDKTGFGGILADEMGLGKTIQVIYYIREILKEEKCQFLIVVPTSLAYNWVYEFNKFGSDIKVLLMVGNRKDRDNLFESRYNYDVIITTYGLLREDEEKYVDNYHTVIIDEAQNIKNYMAGVSKAVKRINAKTKFALTGTPIENSTLELWSIFDFIMPGYLSSLQKFQGKYKINDFNDDSELLIKGLNNQINPFILRRRKKDVIKELPDKLENNIFIDLSDEQKKLYVSELEDVKRKMDELMAEGGMSRVRFMILQLLMKLRQICIDPAIIYDDYKGGSNKIDTLISVINESISNNHKILVFTSFKTALNIVKEKLDKEGITSYVIDGSVKSHDRISRVDEFNNNSNPCVFLIMLKSGGTGLNLTGADVVIHLDLWWNPQAENQATDRAHRIGQKNTVEVIKLVTRGTIEEKILSLQEKKKMLSDKIIDGSVRDSNIISSLTEKDIRNLLTYENKDS